MIIAEIKERYTIPMIGRELFPDWHPAKSCRSPFREDHSPSFSVFNFGKSFMDFADHDVRGDVIDFYAIAKGITPGEALNELWNRIELEGRTSSAGNDEPEPEKKKTDPNDPYALPYKPSQAEYKRMGQDCHRLVNNFEAKEAMVTARAWSIDVIDDLAYEGVLGLSADGCITFNFLSGSKSRWLDETGKRRFRWNFGKPWFWRGDQIAQSDNIWILEGETKAIKALCWNWEKDSRRVIALPAANFDPTPWAYLFRDKEVAYIMDPDPAGERAAHRVKHALGPVARSVIVLNPDLSPHK